MMSRQRLWSSARCVAALHLRKSPPEKATWAASDILAPSDRSLVSPCRGTAMVVPVASGHQSLPWRQEFGDSHTN